MLASWLLPGNCCYPATIQVLAGMCYPATSLTRQLYECYPATVVTRQLLLPGNYTSVGWNVLPGNCCYPAIAITRQLLLPGNYTSVSHRQQMYYPATLGMLPGNFGCYPAMFQLLPGNVLAVAYQDLAQVPKALPGNQRAITRQYLAIYPQPKGYYPANLASYLALTQQVSSHSRGCYPAIPVTSTLNSINK